MKMHVTPNFKKEWKVFKEPVKTLDELQEALDVSSDFITLYIVKSISVDGVLEYTPVKCDTLDDETRIYLWGAKFTQDGAIAIVKLCADGETGEEYLAYC